MRHKRIGLLAGACLATTALVLPTVATASAGHRLAPSSMRAMQRAASHASPQAAGASLDVVAQGLDNPRGVTVGHSGAVYVAEAGRAGSNCSGGGCFGFTSGITRVRHGHQKRIVGGLLSLGGKDGSFTVGADDMALGHGSLFTIMTSAGGKQEVRDFLGARAARQSGNLLQIAPSGSKSVAARINRFEYAHDPDGMGIDSDPYSVAYDHGRELVADAAGNDLLKVTPSGKVHLLAVFPDRIFNGNSVQAVPTSVAVGPDGAYYVGELAGESAPENKARVWRVVPGQAPTVWARGFNTIIGLDFGPDGSLYVAELLRHGFGQLAGPNPDLTGALYRLSPDGSSRTELAKGKLQAPGGVGVSAHGAAYVSVNSVFPGAGELVKIHG